MAERPLLGRQLSINFVYEFIDQDQPYIGTTRARVGQIPRDHDERFTRNSTYKLSLDYGLTSRLTVGVLLPFLDRLHQHIGHEEQEAPGNPDDIELIKKTERWRYQEFGDIQLTLPSLLAFAARIADASCILADCRGKTPYWPY